MFAHAESGEAIWVVRPLRCTRARRHTVAGLLSPSPLSRYLERAPQFGHQQNALAAEPLGRLERQQLIKNIAVISVSLSIKLVALKVRRVILFVLALLTICVAALCAVLS